MIAPDRPFFHIVPIALLMMVGCSTDDSSSGTRDSGQRDGSEGGDGAEADGAGTDGAGTDGAGTDGAGTDGAGNNGDGSGGVDGIASADSTLQSPEEAFQAATVGNNPDSLITALAARAELEFEEWQMVYLWQLDWAENDEAVLTDPIVHRMLGLIADELRENLKLADNCEPHLLEPRRETYRQICLPIQNMKFELTGEPLRPFTWAAAATATWNRLAASGQGDDEGESAEAMNRCNQPGASADRILLDELNPCLQTPCVAVINEVRGENCGNPNSLDLWFENVCGFSIVVQYCFVKAGLEDRCPIKHLDVGERTGAEGGANSCDADAYYVRAMAEDVYNDGSCFF